MCYIAQFKPASGNSDYISTPSLEGCTWSTSTRPQATLFELIRSHLYNYGFSTPHVELYINELSVIAPVPSVFIGRGCWPSSYVHTEFQCCQATVGCWHPSLPRGRPDPGLHSEVSAQTRPVWVSVCMCTSTVWTLVYYLRCLCTTNIRVTVVECIFVGVIALGKCSQWKIQYTVCYLCDTAFASRFGMALDHYLEPVCRDPLSDPNGPLSSSVPRWERVETNKEAIPESSLASNLIFSHDYHTPTVVTSLSPLPCNCVFSQHYHVAQQVHLCLQSPLPSCSGLQTLQCLLPRSAVIANSPCIWLLVEMLYVFCTARELSTQMPHLYMQLAHLWNLLSLKCLHFGSSCSGTD